MTDTDRNKVRELLVATRFGVSALEMPIIIQVEQEKALAIIHELIAAGEDIQSLGEKDNPPELVLYSIGAIEP